MLKKTKATFEKDKLKFAVIAALAIFILKDCAGGIMEYTKKRTVSYITTPEQINKIHTAIASQDLKIKKLTSRIVKLEKGRK